MNVPYIPFYTGDWKKDPQLSLCSPSTRGIWMDALCAMHDIRAHSISGTPDQLSRVCRCSASEMISAINELNQTKTADVSEVNGTYTITCRRIKKAIALSEIRSASAKQKGSKTEAKHQHPSDNAIGTGTSTEGVQRNGECEGKGDRPRKPSDQSDEEWLIALKADKAFEGIDVDRELAKMRRWCQENNQRPSRRRFVNWLNRVDRGISVQRKPEPNQRHEHIEIPLLNP